MLDTVLQRLLMPGVTALGYELWGVERLPQRRGTLVRVYLDKPQGITIADCEQVSYQVSGILDVESLIAGEYTLEVSSPGEDRPLFTLAHFQRFIGSKAHVRLSTPLQGRRNFTGILKKVEENKVFLLEGEIEYSLPYHQIEKARLEPEKK